MVNTDPQDINLSSRGLQQHANFHKPVLVFQNQSSLFALSQSGQGRGGKENCNSTSVPSLMHALAEEGTTKLESFTAVLPQPPRVTICKLDLDMIGPA